MATTCENLRVDSANGFAVVPLDLFLGGRAPATDLYAYVGDDPEPRSVADRSQPVTDEGLRDWVAAGLHGVMIKERDLVALLEAMEGSYDEVLSERCLSTAERFRVLQVVTRSNLGKRLTWADVDEWVAETGQVAARLTELVVRDGIAARSLFEAASHEASALVHATNVAAYLLLLAGEMGVHDPNQLREIAHGAILHDFGKRFVPNPATLQRGAFDAGEKHAIDSHPTLGYEALLGRPGVTRNQLMMVYQHHEWVNGGGEPVAIRKDEIHPWARMLAVVDEFDHATAQTPARKRMDVKEALVHIAVRAGKQFAPEVVRCWISVFDRESPIRFGPGSTSPRPLMTS